MALWRYVASFNLIKIDPGSGIKPLPKTFLTCNKWGALVFTGEQFHSKKCVWYLPFIITGTFLKCVKSTTLFYKDFILKICQCLVLSRHLSFFFLAFPETTQQAGQCQIQWPTCEDQPGHTGASVTYAAVSRTAVRHRGDSQQGECLPKRRNSCACH